MLKRTATKDFNTYTSLKSKAIGALESGDIEMSLDYLYLASTFAWNVPLGIWYDDELESLVFRISQQLKNFYAGGRTTEIGTLQHHKQGIVHLVSFLSDIGGHSKVVRQWVKLLADSVSSQHIYVTNVSNTKTRFSYLDDFARQGIDIKILPQEESYIRRIQRLVEYFQQDDVDSAILYINPNDVIAVTAVQILQKRPCLFYYNHADHVFWLGRNIVDTLINYRNSSAHYSASLRKITRNVVLPLTTDFAPQNISKKTFKVPEKSTLSVSVGSYYKLLGDKKWDYFKTIDKILQQFPSHYHLLVTNASRKGIEHHLSKNTDIRRRFIVCGPCYNLEPIYSAADFLIETFPISGGMVQVEAMACGLPIVAVKNTSFALLSDSGTIPSDYPLVGSTEEDIVTFSSELIMNPEERKKMGEYLYTCFKETMNSDKIRDMLHRLVTEKKDCSMDLIKEEVPTLDFDYAYRVHHRLPLHKIIFFQSFMKETRFSYQNRIRFYTNCIKNKELSPLELGTGVILFPWGNVFLREIYNHL